MTTPAPAAGALGQDALRLYETLLGRPGTSLDELAALLGLPTQSVAPLVETLRDSGFLRGPAGSPVAAAPDLVVEELLAAHYARLAAESARIAQIRRELSGMSGAVREAAARDPRVEVVLNLDGIQAGLAEHTVRCREELLCMVHRAAGLGEASAPLLGPNADAARRGVSLRTLMPDDVTDDPDGWAYARACVEYGDDVRTSPSIALIANVFDRRTAMVPMDPDDSRAGALVVRNPTLVMGLVSLFEQLWPTALPIQRHAPSAPLEERDREVLELLLRGAKDEQVARALQLSVRTVRTRIAALMARAGARSRFQLAAVALHHGWISAG
ncbi:MAG TPA: helix-turn-helix transcriptional regulator [Mycobacteriales bacterium]